jgi:hypothetical protein
MALEIYEEKWIKKVRAAKPKWLEMVKKAESFEAYVKGIAAVTGLPEDIIRASFPAKNWAEFQANAEKYVDIWISKIETAYKQRKWSRNYKQAFTIPAK